MPYSKLLLALLLCFSVACKKKEFYGCTPEALTYTFSTGKQIDTVRTDADHLKYEIKEGSDLVFLYQHVAQDCKEVENEDFTEDVVFQVPPAAAVDSFSYTDDELKNINCLYRLQNWLDESNPRPVTQGKVHGIKVDANQWKVQFYIVIPDKTATLSIDTTFQLQTVK